MDRHQKRLTALHIVASDVSTVRRAKVAAALYRGSRLICYGVNQTKTHPVATDYAKVVEANQLHAEVAALYRAAQLVRHNDLSDMTLYVARSRFTCPSRKAHMIDMAKPCSGCMRALKRYGVRRVYWTETPNSYGVTTLT